MKNSQWRQFLVALFCISLVAQIAAAQTQVPDCAVDPACVSLFERAKQQSSSGQLDEAFRLYKQAYELRADPRLLFSIARVLQKQSRWEESISYFQLFIDSNLLAEGQKQKAREYITQCQAELAVRPRPQTPAESGSKSAVDSPTQTGSLPRSAETTQAARPVYSKWWFWVAMGGVAVVAAGVATGVILGTRADTTPVTAERMLPTNTLVVSF